jgi:Family of unknown function (DUF6492)
MLGTVIVVSCARDLGVNEISIPAVMKHIRATCYLVVVPKRDASQFVEFLPREVRVIAEESLMGDVTLDAVARSLPAGVAQRAGWYFQQLLKIEAIRQMPPTSEALIWDGDTVPLRSIVFKDAEDRIGFYVGRECHEPYFDATRRLLGMTRAIPHSFIAQCMYVRARWIHEIVATIERRAGTGWMAAILAGIPGKSPSEFSEYETIGTFVATQLQAEMFINPRPWFRWGMAHFGGVDRMSAASLDKLSRSYDFVAFESWDRGPAAFIRSQTQRLLDGLRR